MPPRASTSTARAGGRGSRVSASPSEEKRAAQRRKSVVESDESDEESDEEAEEEDVEENDDEEEEEDDIEDEGEDEDEEEYEEEDEKEAKAKKEPRRSRSVPVKKQARASQSTSHHEEDDQEEEEEEEQEGQEEDEIESTVILRDGPASGNPDDDQERPTTPRQDAAGHQVDASINETTPQAARFQKQSQATPANVPSTPSMLGRPSMAPVTPAPPKTRLVIHKMVLRNFKSYAGEQVIGPFHKSFSAVVGPNGSGKSNVIDAMLFVFGWRANKMRQGKLSELIHHSSGQENISQCSVEVWFREIVDLPGPDDFKVVPGSKLIVARTAFKNNSSVYTLNGKKSNYTEVTTLLRGRGIDLDHKRFLILQGEVESIAQMPPKAKNEHEEGLLEYLEDIIGTNEFKAPIEEASKLVDEANDERGQKLTRLKVVQKEKDSLESKKREAEAFLRDQNELAQRQSALWQVYMLECKDQMSISSKAMEKLKKRIQEETEKNSGAKAEIESLEAEYTEMAKDFENIKKETDKVFKELARFEKEDVQLQEKSKHLETKKKKLTKSMAEEKSATFSAKTTLENSSGEIEMLQADLTKLESSLEREEAELDVIRDSLKDKTKGFSQAIEEKQRELQPWAAKRSEKQNAKEVALEERKLLEERTGQVERDLEEAKKALADLEEGNRDKREALEGLKRQRVEADEKAKSYVEEIASMEAEETKLRIKAQAARSKAEEAKASVQSNRSRGDVLNSLKRQADLGMIRGFQGRLGSLGVIDDKYDVAISTACPGLDNIVVDGVATGQACIEHLRKNNLGRANFILLDSLKINAEATKRPRDIPDDVPRLIDLVKPKEPRFAAAFYHQLRDTLVARDLAHANRIAYGAKRWRVVTLDGQLIDKSGTMSGGGTRIAKGGMSSKFAGEEFTLEQIAKFVKEHELAEDALRNHVKYTNDMRSLMEDARSKAPQIDMAIDKVVMDLDMGVKLVEEAKRRMDEVRGQSQPDAGDVERIAELNASLKTLDSELEKVTAKTSTIEADIEALQEKILEAGGVGLRTQKSKVDGIKERIELSAERITKAEVAKAKAEKDLGKLSKSTKSNQATLEKLEAELQELAEEAKTKTEASATVRAKVEEAREVMETRQESKDEIKAQLDEKSQVINAFRSLEVEIKQKLEDHERSFAENEKRLQHWQEKWAKLELHKIDSDADEFDDEGEAGEKKEQQQNEGRANADGEGEDGDETVQEAGIKSKKEAKAKKEAEEESDEDEDGDSSIELQEFSEDELRAIDKESVKAEIVVFEEKVQMGMGNLSILQEYRKREQELLSRMHDLEMVTKQRDMAKQRHDDLRKQRLESFMAGFAVISAKLKEMYQTITLGGNAELELVDSLDPFSEGILFSVMPPKKSWKNISNLSGGEKTLSSLALVFALHAFKPTPLYAMDELDAALDFRNVSIVANLIKERTKGAQFIVISLRNNMFELASRLVGIYKTNGQTKSLAVHNSDLHAPPPALPPPPSTIQRSQTMMMPTPLSSRPSSSVLPPPPTPSARFGLTTPIPATPRPKMKGLGIPASTLRQTAPGMTPAASQMRLDMLTSTAKKRDKSLAAASSRLSTATTTPLATARQPSAFH